MLKLGPSGSQETIRTGRKPSNKCVWGIGLFRNSDGYTSVACAVSLLVVISLVFATASFQWSQSKAADIQTVADAGATASVEVLATYSTVATILDACVLSLGLTGAAVLVIGTVVAVIPPISEASPVITDAGMKILQARGKFARSAYEGLERLEKLLPTLMMLACARTLSDNSRDGATYIGGALPFPLESASEFGVVDDGVDDESSEIAQDTLEARKLMDESQIDREKSDSALEQGWLADSGGSPRNMRERANHLGGLSGLQNPEYPSKDGWNFGVALDRATLYYKARCKLEAPDNNLIEERVRSECRWEFYNFSFGEMQDGTYRENSDGTVSIDLPELPKNKNEMKKTDLYDRVLWPVSEEQGELVIHGSPACPGSHNPTGGYATLEDLDNGEVIECPTCKFNAADMGRVASASTSIDNGFEYYWCEVVEASRDYEKYANEAARLENEAQEETEDAADAFSEALEKLSVPRPQILPPGRNGVIAVVLDSDEHDNPDKLITDFYETGKLPPRAAISGALLAKDTSTEGSDVLSSFFDRITCSLTQEPSPVGIVDGFMGLWSGALMSYSQGYEELNQHFDTVFSALNSIGMNRVSSWLEDTLKNTVSLIGFEPVDLSLKKPVLCNTADVLEASGYSAATDFRSFITTVPGAQDMGNKDLLGRDLVKVIDETYGGEEIVLAEIPIPGTDAEVPISCSVSDLLSVLL